MIGERINTINRFAATMISFIILVSLSHSQPSPDYLSGYVYNGNQGDETNPISGVTVTLYGASNIDQLGSQITSTITNSSGHYSLSAPSGYEYYSILETDPSGYQSVAASSPDGTVVNSNRIRYSIAARPLSDQNTSNNKFWDKPSASVNHPPIAVDDFATTFINTPISISVLSNDNDPDGDPVSLQSVTAPTHGSAVINGNQVFYSPHSGYTGSDQCGYTISDGRGGSATATISIRIAENDTQNGSAGDRVWHDQNHNGLQDAGEPGIPNAQVSLSDQQDNLLATTSTSGNGQFMFSNLLSGGYYLTFSPPPGYVFSYPDQGMDEAIDSDADQVTGKTAVFTLASGETNLNLDAGMYAPDECYYDYGDAPSSYPSAGHPLGGPWFGKLADAPDAEISEQTSNHAEGDDQDGNDDEDGLCQMNLVAGKMGWIYMDVIPGPSGVISASGWIDFNHDGDWNDSGEQIGGLITWFTPSSGGWYPPGKIGFGMSVPGQSYIGKTFARFRIEEGPTGLIPVDGLCGAGEVEDYEVEILQDGAGLPPGGVIFGAKWNDENGNGQWDATEAALPGWTIWLDANKNMVEDAGDLYDITDGSGWFEFTGLAKDTYILGEKMKSGWIQTFPGISPFVHSVSVDPFTPSTGYFFGNRLTGQNSDTGKAKWNQPPVFDPVDEDTSYYTGWLEPSIISESYCADDWFCHDATPVTGIRWWGSYTEWDSIAPPDTAPSLFHIGVWSDDPAGAAGDFGSPARMIREWYIQRIETSEIPVKSYLPPGASGKPMVCFQYTFDISQDAWFEQEGDSNIYWLHIAAVYEDIPEIHQWGWLTREHYFHNDAVRVNQPLNAHPDAVYELGESLPYNSDMTFVLKTDEIISTYDFGDMPDHGYGTTILRNGPMHLLNQDVYLGERLDSDLDGQPHYQAQGDDDDGMDDEDGIQLLYPDSPDNEYQLRIQVSANGFLNGWMDANQNGQWDFPDEHIIDDVMFAPGTHFLDMPAFSNMETGDYKIRFRFSRQPNVWVRGYAMDGETEDYIIHIDAVNSVMVSRTPGQFMLYQNFPNPFNPATTIVYDLPEKTHVRIMIYNLSGQNIVELVNEMEMTGRHSIMWHGTNGHGHPVGSGIYICDFRADDFQKSIKLLFIR